MKNCFVTTALILVFCCLSQFTFSQQISENISESVTKANSDNNELIKKYTWLKVKLDQAKEPIISIKEMEAEGGVAFVFVESEDAIVMYDIEGKMYCKDRNDLNCKEFYKLSEGSLNWSR